MVRINFSESQEQYIRSLDIEQRKEMLRHSSKEDIANLASLLSPSDIEYALKTLPVNKGDELQAALDRLKEKDNKV
ncbi:MAG: hypothetical protein K940chlam6_00994 [Chlamydiae bacterium]|nr:hypothetical protein [Chlamydiota bacterium]